MATDIVPELLDKITKEFNEKINSNRKINNIKKLLDNGTATYIEANIYAVEVGEALASVFKNNITLESLPEGILHYNIAERIIHDRMRHNHKLVSTVSVQVQENLNKSVGLGLKGVEASYNKGRVEDIVNRVSGLVYGSEVAMKLQEPIVNITQSVVNDTLDANMRFQGESGLNPKVVRRADYADACDWCKSMQGTYDYPVNKSVYARHDNCRCTVEYMPDPNRRQNVWTKEWRS